MTQPAHRHASPQAWARVRKAIGPGEANDLARDIANIIRSEEARTDSHIPLAQAIEYALVGYPWDRQTQV